MIAILLATYNSGRFLREQLDSLFNQTFQNWNLYIHDDGSNDDTLEIVGEYSKKYPNRIYIVVPEKKGLGAYKNFVTILQSVEADYYMFCDHDDVWLPNKIELSYARMMAEECSHKGKPIIVHTDMKNVDTNLNVLSDSFWRSARLLPDHVKFAELVSCNCVNGCTTLFNNLAKKVMLQNVEYGLMHDALLAQSVAANNGIISAVKIPLVMYRQHGDNVIGACDIERTYFKHRAFNIGLTFKREYLLWKRIKNIQNISLLNFLFTKIKITILRYYA